jgi:hypothetical protein
MCSLIGLETPEESSGDIDQTNQTLSLFHGSVSIITIEVHEYDVVSHSAPGENRTPDLEIRRLLLYPSELRGQISAHASSVTTKRRTKCDETDTKK